MINELKEMTFTDEITGYFSEYDFVLHIVQPLNFKVRKDIPSLKCPLPN